MREALTSTHLPELGTPTKGKVRDIYQAGQSLIIISCDRISVFDQILPSAIPDKGKVLNLLSKFWFDQTADLIPNHAITVPDPNVLIAKRCRVLPIEVVVRGYLAGSLWRDYAMGKREKCGVPLPNGLQKHDPLPQPIITPTSKSRSGHDLDLSPEQLIEQRAVSKILWGKISEAALALFQRGSSLLKERGMILVDTKYEFGIDAQGVLTLIDEVHTPDSSRFWYQNDPEKRFKDKEYARIWASDQGFRGEGKVPEIPQNVQEEIRRGYLEIFRSVTGKPCPETEGDIHKRLRTNLVKSGVIKMMETPL